MSEKKHTVTGAIQLLEELGVTLNKMNIINIYGPPMVGKSLFACALASEWVGSNGEVIVLGFEPSYKLPEYTSMLARYLRARHKILRPRTEEVFRLLYGIRKSHEYRGKNVAIIIDSLSAIATRESALMMAISGTREPRVIAARVVPFLIAIAEQLSEAVEELGGIGIMVTQASSTAGATKYRGRFDMRPSMAARVAHFITYELLMTTENSHRVLTVTAARVKPSIEGKSIKFRFLHDRIEPIKTK